MGESRVVCAMFVSLPPRGRGTTAGGGRSLRDYEICTYFNCTRSPSVTRDACHRELCEANSSPFGLPTASLTGGRLTDAMRTSNKATLFTLCFERLSRGRAGAARRLRGGFSCRRPLRHGKPCHLSHEERLSDALRTYDKTALFALYFESLTRENRLKNSKKWHKVAQSGTVGTKKGCKIGQNEKRRCADGTQKFSSLPQFL